MSRSPGRSALVADERRHYRVGKTTEPAGGKKTYAEARAELSEFLRATGCYDICRSCPVYPGGEGCCQGCAHLLRNEQGKVQGCANQNLSCLSYTCGVLNEHLRRQADPEFGNQLNALTQRIYGLPREGYRGCQKRASEETIVWQDPLRLVAHLHREEGSCSLSANQDEGAP